MKLTGVAAALVASCGWAFHCSNDAPTPLSPPPQKAEAMKVMHDHVHGDGPVAPGYKQAVDYITARHLRGDAPSTPPSLQLSFLRTDAVQLLPGSRGFNAQNLSLTWLKSLNADRLLSSFRATANLSTNGAATYGGWEDSTCLLRGHIAGGHFLSGAALLVNSTGDAQLASTLQYMVGELVKCQDAIGTGYLSAFGTDHFDRLESDTQPIWAPYYTIHKILRGLYDVYSLTGDARPLAIANKMLSYFAGRIRNVITQRTISAWYAILNVESGGMGEVSRLWYGAGVAAGAPNPDALYVAEAFVEPCWSGPLSLGADVLSDMHANTHIPVVIGDAQKYQDTGDARMLDAVQGFYSAVTTAHSFVTGGSSSGEWWGDAHRMGDQLSVNGVETCTTYNILKLSRTMFSWSLDTTLMDFWERAKFSGMFGSVHPNAPGAVIYLLPVTAGQGASKAHSYWGWSDPFDSMWCCVGSAMESHSKHGDTLYAQQAAQAGAGSTLLVLIYEPSAVTWSPPTAAGAALTLTQNGTWSSSMLSVTMTVKASGSIPASTSIALRVPSWAEAPQATINGQTVTATGGWFNITRAWASGDVILLTFPFTVKLERLDDDRMAQYGNYYALTAGPHALGAITRTDGVIVGDNSSTTPAWVRPVTDDERKRAVSFFATSYPAASTYIRHDNVTGVWAAPLSLPGKVSPAGGPVSYALQPQQGFLAAGDDVLVGNFTLAQAEAACTANSSCVAFTFESSNPSPTTPVLTYLKSAVQFTGASGWYTYVSSRVPTNPLGGDEDGPDSTWILDPPLAPGAPPQAQSLRSMNRPGEYIMCPASGQCAIAHDTGSGTTAFQTASTFILHSPGLNGVAGTYSMESLLTPGSFVSWYGAANATGPAPLTLQPVQQGNAAFANASTFDASSGPNWLPPPLAYVAQTANPAVPNSRDLLLYPIADIASEWYIVYLQLQKPSE